MSSREDFALVFNRLKSIFQPYADNLTLKVDTQEEYFLNTVYIMKNKKPLYFGSVKINKNYVSFHLMPVYVFPEILKEMSSALRMRMQGKSCFNFTSVDEVLFKELTKLTKNGHSQYHHAGYV